MLTVPSELVLGVVIAAAIAAVLYRAVGLRRGGPPGPLPVVALKTRSDTILTGRLRSRDRDVIVLTGAQKLDETQPNAPPSATPLDGDVVIPWANVDWWQEGLPAELLDREP